MRRELNPQLFQTSRETGGGVPMQELNRIESDYRDLETQILTTKTHMQSIDRKVESLQAQFEELVRSIQGRLERFSQQVTRLEATSASNTQESAAKYAAVAGKLNERRVSDMKVQELVDRHNTLVLNFENRLTNLTRLLSEQEMKMHSSSAALDEARQEITRLKGFPSR